MITEDYVSFETAKLLKEKGFDEKDVDMWYDKSGEKFYELYHDIKYNWRIKNHEKVFQCPTLQMAMKWLREVHHYYIQVMLDSWAYGGHSGYYVIIQRTDSEFEIMLADKADKVFYDEPEEACEAGIKYCLENLI